MNKQNSLCIFNNVDALTLNEQRTILQAKFYVYSESIGGNILLNVNGIEIFWCCSNKKTALEYLIKNKITCL